MNTSYLTRAVAKIPSNRATTYCATRQQAERVANEYARSNALEPRAVEIWALSPIKGTLVKRIDISAWG